MPKRYFGHGICLDCHKFRLDHCEQYKIITTVLHYTQLYNYHFKSNSILFSAYFGLNLCAGDLSDNIYLSFILLGLVELPALIAIWFLDHWGRNPTLVVSFLLCGICCICAWHLSSSAASVNKWINAGFSWGTHQSWGSIIVPDTLDIE